MTNATWKKKPGSTNYDDGNNWSGGTVPDGTATFGASSKHALTFSGNNTIDAWVFTAQAGHYTFAQPTGFELEFDGAGISVKGGSAAIDVSGHVIFANGAVASKAHFTIENESALDFGGTSKASASVIHIKSEGQASFFGSSTATNAHITVAQFGNLQFEDSGTAGKATIETTGAINLNETASMGSATLTIDQGDSSSVIFYDLSTAGSAKIADNALLEFTDNSTAGSAVITVADGAKLEFFANSTGGDARIIDKAGGTVDFSGTDGPINGITVGSIQGGGSLFLGGQDVQIGNELSTTLSGLISDGGVISGTSGSLTKVGTGTLTLAHADNTFTGGTFIDSGTVAVAAVDAAGTGAIFFEGDDIAAGKLKIQNSALSSHVFNNTIDGFAPGFVIDLAGLAFTKNAHFTASGLGGGLVELDVTSGKITDTLLFEDPDSLANFKLKNDGHGHTEVVMVAQSEKHPGHSSDHIVSAGGGDIIAVNGSPNLASTLSPTDIAGAGHISLPTTSTPSTADIDSLNHITLPGHDFLL